MLLEFFCVFNSQLQSLAVVWNIHMSLGSVYKAVVAHSPVRVVVPVYT